MESSAFIEIGQQFVPAELVHSIKIVSDNIKKPFKDITTKVIAEHVSSAIDSITILQDCMAPFVKSWIKIESDPDCHTDENCSGVCNDIPLNSCKMLNWMTDGHVLVNGDDKNVKNHGHP